MPTVTADKPVTIEETAEALREKLGSRYEVTTRGSGAQEALKVKRSATSLATVRLSQEGSTTTFYVHGGGLVITRMINEFGLAKRVAAAIKDSFGQASPTDSASG
jgi:hypothetical protein